MSLRGPRMTLPTQLVLRAQQAPGTVQPLPARPEGFGRLVSRRAVALVGEVAEGPR